MSFCTKADKLQKKHNQNLYTSAMLLRQMEEENNIFHFVLFLGQNVCQGLLVQDFIMYYQLFNMLDGILININQSFLQTFQL